MWLVATVLESTNREYFCRQRKFYQTVLSTTKDIETIVESHRQEKKKIGTDRESGQGVGNTHESSLGYN